MTGIVKGKSGIRWLVVGILVGLLVGILIGFSLQSKPIEKIKIKKEPWLPYCQGLGWDGNHWYFSTSHEGDFNDLYKLDNKSNLILKEENVIPSFLVKEGYDHIGDLDYWNGKLYIPIEHKPVLDGLRINATFAVYDSQLNFVGEWFKTSQFHAPWCAIDPETGYLYSSEWNDAWDLYAYDLVNGGKLVKKIHLDKRLSSVQGGDFYQGYLYLCLDDLHKDICKIDSKNGKVLDLIATKIPEEMEGVTLHKTSNGFIHFVAGHYPVEDVGYLYHLGF
jgi:hypothetical protein